MLLWGGGWPALKILTQSVSVEVLSFWRFFLMFLAFLPIIYFYKKPLHLSPKGIKYITLSALLNVAFMFLAFYGVMYGLAGSGGVLVTTLSPLLTFALVLLIHRKRVSASQIAGLFLGLLGGAVMMELWQFDAAQFLDGGNLFFLLAALTWAFITLLSQRSHLHIDPLHYTFALSAAATLILFLLALPYGILAVFEQGAPFWGALLYLAILGQTVASTIYFYASGKLGSSRASSYMFLVPVSALLISWLLLGEVPSLPVIFGGTLSTLAVYLINRKERSHAKT